MERSREYHPLLRGGKRRRNSRGKYNTHDYSSAQMESLTSICEAILPPIESEFLETKGIQPTSKAMKFFWKVSGCDLSIPHQYQR
ncbi:hypothetical protein TSUD_28220 [Trifolium subterraneum]|uniref:Uncharacterized protein n=1 Tax=Trifolium subterraneum TaxID=3900 RepID=A0A2Z6NS22_TRISU|nr:hypothetical protein TSUD_28220 [Trifolium subterraneum]